MREYTHLAKIYGIPCYFNEETMDVMGTNPFYDFLIECRIQLERVFPMKEGFYVELIKEL